jgi:hypothetical protein
VSVMTVTTRITRQYLERKTKSDLAQMYLDLLDHTCDCEASLKDLVNRLERMDDADVEFTERFGVYEAIGRARNLLPAEPKP